MGYYKTSSNSNAQSGIIIFFVQNQKRRVVLGLINNFLILLGWIVSFLKLMIIYWYVSVPAILILIYAVYFEHKRKHRSDGA
jgi:hypothetical protein